MTETKEDIAHSLIDSYSRTMFKASAEFAEKYGEDAAESLDMLNDTVKRLKRDAATGDSNSYALNYARYQNQFDSLVEKLSDDSAGIN